MKKKIISIMLILSIMLFLLQLNVFASSIPLESVTVNVTKEKIAPGEDVTVNINFGAELRIIYI